MKVLRQLRSLVYTIPLCIVATVLLFMGGLLTATEDGVRIQRRLFKYWARWILWVCRLRVRVRGIEVLQTGTPFVFASNHASLLDAPALIAAIPHDLCFLVTYSPIPGLELFLHRTGQITIRRWNQTELTRTLREAGEALALDQRSLLVFPEGSRSDTGLSDFRNEAALLAVSTRRPLIPVYIQGSRAALPRYSALMTGGTIDVHFGPPIDTSGLDPETVTKNLRKNIGALARAR